MWYKHNNFFECPKVYECNDPFHTGLSTQGVSDAATDLANQSGATAAVETVNKVVNKVADIPEKINKEFNNVINNPTDPIDWTDKGSAELAAAIATGGSAYVVAMAEAAAEAGASDEDIAKALNTISLGVASASGVMPIGAAIGGAVADQTGGKFDEGMAIGTAAQVAIGAAIMSSPLAGTAAGAEAVTTAETAASGVGLPSLGTIAKVGMAGYAAYQGMSSDGESAPDIGGPSEQDMQAQRETINNLIGDPTNSKTVTPASDNSAELSRLQASLDSTKQNLTPEGQQAKREQFNSQEEFDDWLASEQQSQAAIEDKINNFTPTSTPESTTYDSSLMGSYDKAIDSAASFDGSVTYNPVQAASGATAGHASGAGASAGQMTAASVDYTDALSSLDGAIDNTAAFFQVEDGYIKDFTSIFGNPSNNISTYFEDYKPEQLEAQGLGEVKQQFQEAANRTKQQLAMSGLSGSGIEKGVLNDVKISEAEALSQQRVKNFDTYYDKLMNYNVFEAQSKISLLGQQMQTLGMQNDLDKTYAQMAANEENINAQFQQQASQVNASLATQASIASASNATSASIANANNTTRVNMQNQDWANKMGMFNSQMQYAADTAQRNFDWSKQQYQDSLGINKYNSALGYQTQLYGADRGVALNQAQLDMQQNQVDATNQAGWMKFAGGVLGATGLLD